LRRLVIAAVVVGVASADCAASRKFTSSQYLLYNSAACGAPKCSPYVSGLTSFGVATWIKRNPSTGDQVIVGNLTSQGHGFLLLLDGSDGPGDPDQVVFRYRYPSGPAASPVVGTETEPVLAGPHSHAGGGGIEPGLHTQTQVIEVAADVSGVQFDGAAGLWFHVAADLDLPAGTARMFLNGVPTPEVTGPELDPAVGGTVLAIGGGAGGNWFNGDLHDVCVVEGVWTAEPGRMSACVNPNPSPCISAADAVALTGTATLRFNARLRQSPVDLVQAVPPQVVPSNATVIQGMGPPINYGDQAATVLVIGDTQFLDYDDHSEDPNTSVEMKKLGAFVRDYRDSLRVSAVFHVGDWVDHGGAGDQEVHRARALADKFNEACIPWSCTIGNHDYHYVAGYPAAPWLQYWSSLTSYTMPTVLFKEPPCAENWSVAQMTDWPPGSDDVNADEAYAHAFDFEIDGEPQLGMTIPYMPSVPMLEWAQATANAPENAGKPVWLATHLFVDYAGNQGPDAQFWWDYYLQFIPNLRFVFCGHYTYQGIYLAYHRCDGIYDLQPVHQLLVNGQSAPGGGQGFLQILEVSLGTAGEFTGVNVESYIPLEDRFLTNDSNHEFTLDFAPCGQDCNDNGLADRYDIHSGASGDSDGDNVPDECEAMQSASPFDLDGDGTVGITDLLSLLNAWGPGPAKPADFNHDDSVGLADLIALLGAWGPSSG
jgi:hypothetical protein